MYLNIHYSPTSSLNRTRLSPLFHTDSFVVFALPQPGDAASPRISRSRVSGSATKSCGETICTVSRRESRTLLDFLDKIESVRSPSILPPKLLFGRSSIWSTTSGGVPRKGQPTLILRPFYHLTKGCLEIVSLAISSYAVTPGESPLRRGARTP